MRTYMVVVTMAQRAFAVFCFFAADILRILRVRPLLRGKS